MQKVADYLAIVIDESPLKQREIAEQVGWNRPNFVSLIKKGDAKIPLEKVSVLASALSIDATDLMIRCLREYQPAVLDVLNIQADRSPI